jgi:hypothetical protein
MIVKKRNVVVGPVSSPPEETVSEDVLFPPAVEVEKDSPDEEQPVYNEILAQPCMWKGCEYAASHFLVRGVALCPYHHSEVHSNGGNVPVEV